MEFHLPYFALRNGPLKTDMRTLRRSSLRRAKAMFSLLDDPPINAFFYEAQTSFLLVGVDEWFWTAYCCTETFFKSERSTNWYEENTCDGPTARNFPDLPIWNPRLYFLHVLSRRLTQVTREWRNLLRALIYCLEEEVCRSRDPNSVPYSKYVTETAS